MPYDIPEGMFQCSATPWEGSHDRRSWTVYFESTLASSELALPGNQRPILDFPVVRFNHLAGESVTCRLAYSNPAVILPSASPLASGPLMGFEKGITASPVLIVGGF